MLQDQNSWVVGAISGALVIFWTVSNAWMEYRTRAKNVRDDHENRQRDRAASAALADPLGQTRVTMIENMHVRLIENQQSLTWMNQTLARLELACVRIEEKLKQIKGE